MTVIAEQHRALLERIAQRAMLERGLLPDFSAEALFQLEEIQAPAALAGGTIRNLGDLPWASIDNDDSLDLDQLTVAE
ncbi:MAG TPA: RNB domain-containing ribonuclease, partial [Armatimonadota bacterium]